MSGISFGQNALWLIPAFVAAALLTWWTYRNTVPALRPPLKWLLMGVRTTCLGIILFLLAEPLLSRISSLSTPPVLAVLVDESQSLGVTGGTDTLETSNFEKVRALLAGLSLDEVDGDVEVYGFGTSSRRIDAGAGWADSIAFDEQRTDVSRALQLVREDNVGRNLRAVLLVSDGVHNSGRNPVFVADRYPVPILTSVVGDTTASRDLYIRSVVANEIGYVESVLPVRVTLRSDGVEPTNVVVQLSVDGAELASETIRLQSGTEHVVDLSFVPDTPGLKRVSVSVTRLSGEITYRNNVETVAVQILDSKKRVHLLASSPGPDVTAIRAVLETDANVSLTTSVHRTAGEYYGAPLPTDWSDVDLLVLAGFPGASVPGAELTDIASRLPAETSVLFILGNDTDLARLNNAFGDRLPVRAVTIREETLEGTASLTSLGAAHPVLEPIDLTPGDWDRMPPVLLSTSVWRVAPDARVLATARVRGVTLPDPLVAIRQRTGQRSAAFLAAGLWRWGNLPEDLELYDAVFPDLLANLVLWLTAEDDDRRVRIQPISSSFAGSDRISFTGQVYDESLQPISDAAVEVEVVAEDGRRYPLTMEPAGSGRYTIETDALPGGTYTYNATAERNGVSIGTDRGSFVVGDLALEFKETRADPALMRQVAHRSGGFVVSPDELSMLNTRLQSLAGFEPRVETSVREMELWRRYVFLIVAVALLTLEWLLRKRHGLV